VAHIEEIQLEAAVGGPLLEASGHRPEPVVSNVLGNGSLVVPVRFLTSSADGHGKPREFRSGPFYSQEIHLVCKPAEEDLADFFDFEAWSITNASGATLGEGTTAAALPPLSPTAPQAACIVRPRRTDAHRWAKRTSPRSLKLKALVQEDETRTPGRFAARATVQWDFLPQFAAMDDAGKQLEPGDVCAILSPGRPTATVWVWTGGQPVEAAVVGQLRHARLGRLRLLVRSQPPQATAATASISVTVTWDAPKAWAGAQELGLRLESRASGQAQTLVIKVDGALPAPGPGPDRWLLPALGRALLLLLLLAGCCLCCGRGLAPTPVAVPGLGGLAGQGQALGPARGGSPLGVSPFIRVAARQ